MRQEDARRAEREVVHLVHAGLDWATLSLQVGEALRRAMPFDHACWHTVDPATMLFTGVAKDSLNDEVRLPYHEYAIADVNQWADLARRAHPVGILSHDTGGRLESSPRYRELLRPVGVGPELRAAFMADGTCWGACGIYRQRDRADFTPDEARLLGRVGRHLADGYRRALLLAAVEHDTSSSAPGLILFDARCDVELVDPTARAHLHSIVDRIPQAQTADRVPVVVRAVAERARRGAAGMPARARVRSRDGGWLVLFGARLADGPSERLAVLVEPAGPADLWPMIADAYQLTPREREITVLCLRGLSTTDMGRTLHLSPYTVQDHLKVIFEKVGVRARRALVAKIFLDCYWQPILSGQAPGRRSGFTG